MIADDILVGMVCRVAPDGARAPTASMADARPSTASPAATLAGADESAVGASSVAVACSRVDETGGRTDTCTIRGRRYSGMRAMP